eukprot:g35896.t1
MNVLAANQARLSVTPTSHYHEACSAPSQKCHVFGWESATQTGICNEPTKERVAAVCTVTFFLPFEPRRKLSALGELPTNNPFLYSTFLIQLLHCQIPTALSSSCQLVPLAVDSVTALSDPHCILHKPSSVQQPLAAVSNKVLSFVIVNHRVLPEALGLIASNYYTLSQKPLRSESVSTYVDAVQTLIINAESILASDLSRRNATVGS